VIPALTAAALAAVLALACLWPALAVPIGRHAHPAVAALPELAHPLPEPPRPPVWAPPRLAPYTPAAAPYEPYSADARLVADEAREWAAPLAEAIEAGAAAARAASPVPPWPGTFTTGSFRAVCGGEPGDG
jgi:hypothetical protein